MSDIPKITDYLRYKYGKSFTKSQLLMLFRLLKDSDLGLDWWKTELQFLKRFQSFEYYFDEVDKRVVKRTNYFAPLTLAEKTIGELAFNIVDRMR